MLVSQGKRLAPAFVRNGNKRRRASEHVIFITSRGDNNRVLLGFCPAARGSRAAKWLEPADLLPFASSFPLSSSSYPLFSNLPVPFLPAFHTVSCILHLLYHPQSNHSFPASLLNGRCSSLLLIVWPEIRFVIWRTDPIYVFTRLSSASFQIALPDAVGYPLCRRLPWNMSPSSVYREPGRQS